MTLDELVKEGRTCGIGFFDIYDWTVGEVVEYIDCYKEDLNRRYQNLSIIAMKEAELIARFCFGTGNKQMRVFEEFPFWTQEEKADIYNTEMKKKILGNLEG